MTRLAVLALVFVGVWWRCDRGREVAKMSYVGGTRPVLSAHFRTSGQFHAGLPPTVQRGSGNPSPLDRQASTADRETLRRAAISTVPTGSQVMRESVGNVLTFGKRCAHNTYMTRNEEVSPNSDINCPSHGAMAPRDPARQTREQKWCGQWWDCTDPRCSNSILVPSAELIATYPPELRAKFDS